MPLSNWMQKLGRGLVEQSGAVDLAQLPDQVVTDLRSLTTLFQIVARKPPYRTALQHCLDVVVQLRQVPLITSVTVGALLNEVATEFRQMGFEDQAAAAHELEEQFSQITRHDLRVLHLVACLSKSNRSQADAKAVEAVVRALLTELDLAPRVSRARPIVQALHAALDSGSTPLVGVIVERSHADLADIVGLLADDAAFASSAVDAQARATRRTHLTQVIAEHDPAFESAWQEAQHAELETQLTHSGTQGVRALFQSCVDAVRRGDWAAANRHYEKVSRNEDLSIAMRAGLRSLSVGARLNGGLVTHPEAMVGIIDELIESKIFRARAIVDLPLLFMCLSGQSLEINDNCGQAEPAVRVAELSAEHRAGIAVQRPVTQRPDSEDLALVSLLRHDAQLFAPADLSAHHPDVVFVWIASFTTPDDHNGLLVQGLDCVSGRMWVTKHIFVGDLAKIFVQSLGDTSLDLTDDQAVLLSRQLFSDLPNRQDLRLVVVPDAIAWIMPWNRLAPPNAIEVVVAPSAGAADRAREQPVVTRPRVIGLFDIELDGAVPERDMLKELAAKDLVDFVEVHSFEELSTRLTADDFDLLTIAVHGSSGDGFEYRLMFPDGETSPASVFQLALPPIVVLGCCWSAQSTEHPDMVATPVGCLAAGAQLVVGGLWAIADDKAGQMLADTYRRHVGGTPFGQAFRQAYLALRAEDAVEASGLTLIGSPSPWRRD
jgi:hypothetical protein